MSVVKRSTPNRGMPRRDGFAFRQDGLKHQRRSCSRRGEEAELDLPRKSASSRRRLRLLSRPWLCRGMLLSFLWCVCLPSLLAQQFCPHPFIVTPPMSAIVLAGSNVTFSVGMSDYTCQFSYTWRHIVNILGATNPTYTVYDVQPPPSNKAGPYSVVVGNVSGSVASMDA